VTSSGTFVVELIEITSSLWKCCRCDLH